MTEMFDNISQILMSRARVGRALLPRRGSNKHEQLSNDNCIQVQQYNMTVVIMTMV